MEVVISIIDNSTDDEGDENKVSVECKIIFAEIVSLSLMPLVLVSDTDSLMVTSASVVEIDSMSES